MHAVEYGARRGALAGQRLEGAPRTGRHPWCLLAWGFAVSSYVEVWGRSGRTLRALDSERVTVGNLESNDVVVDTDGVSRVHAVFERFGDTWCVRDLGSRNGTFVNGGRIIGERALHPGDEILLGRVHLPLSTPGLGSPAPNRIGSGLGTRPQETLDEDDAYAAAGVTRPQTTPAGELAAARRTARP